MELSFGNVEGLPTAEKEMLEELEGVYEYHLGANILKERYYEGDISVGEVNIGIALPNNIANLEIGCAWGAKTVDVLAARSMFDGFVGVNGEAV